MSGQAAIAEWLEQTGSECTKQAYRDMVQEFRSFLSTGNLDLLDDADAVARVATLWANTRKDTSSVQGDASPSTYNQRLAILSSFYSFLQEVYKLDIPNPIKTVLKRPVQAYTACAAS